MARPLAKRTNKRSKVTLRDKPLAEPEAVCPPLPMRGFYADLTPEQKKRALAYRGEENHSDPDAACSST
jgi:hypothetical protein